MIIYGLSYPRSGGNWIQNIINDIKTEEITYIKTHVIFQQKPDKLIVIVRDFKECMIRHASVNFSSDDFIKKLPQSLSKTPKQAPLSFLHPAYYFAEFTGPKLLIYYEDIINPLYEVKEIQRLADFINADKEKTKRFISEIEQKRASSIHHYGESHTLGKTPIYHSNKLTIPQLFEMDDIIMDRVSKKEKIDRVVNRILKRYRKRALDKSYFMLWKVANWVMRYSEKLIRYASYR